MDPWGTHIHLLAAAAVNTSGPIIEFGCGDYSTPLLHEICRPNRRKLVSLETNKDWALKFMDLRAPWHEVLVADSYEDFDALARQAWDVAFIDHAPAERRIVDIAKLQDTKIIVVHDVDCPVYRYETVLSSFKYRLNYSRVKPWTAAVSHTHPLDFLGRI